jgi:hypothetical protein
MGVTRPREGRNRRHEAVFNPFHVVFRRVSAGSRGGDWPWARPSSASPPPSRSRITIWWHHRQHGRAREGEACQLLSSPYFLSMGLRHLILGTPYGPTHP